MKRASKIITRVILSCCILAMGMLLFGFNGGNKVENPFASETPIVSTFSKSVNAPFQSGDLIFQSSTAGQGQAIQLATHSKYSHVGILFEREGQLVVYEAVQPVKITPLHDFIHRDKNGAYVVKRLKNAKEVLTPEVLQKMKAIGKRFLGKNYDLYFEWSDERIYCSELVWKMYKEATGLEIGKLQPLSDFDLTHPAVKEKIRERYGQNIPLDEWMISPGAMFDSEELYTVKVQL